jgi:hypothetical protein
LKKSGAVKFVSCSALRLCPAPMICSCTCFRAARTRRGSTLSSTLVRAALLNRSSVLQRSRNFWPKSDNRARDGFYGPTREDWEKRLNFLHSQGAIHRNLDPWAVVTAVTDEPDFRMTGFEWSMRIASVAGRQNKKIHAPRVEHSFSFARDWRDLALLFALFLDIPSAALGDLKVIPSRVGDHASASEVRLLRAMLGLEKVARMDGELVCARIDEILDSIERN